MICGPGSITFFTCGKECNDDDVESLCFTDVWNGVRKVSLYNKVEKRSKSGKTTYMEKELVSNGIWIPSQEALEKEAAETKELIAKKSSQDEGGRFMSWPIRLNEMIGIKWDANDTVIPVKVDGNGHILEFLEDGRTFDMRQSAGEEELE